MVHTDPAATVIFAIVATLIVLGIRWLANTRQAAATLNLIKMFIVSSTFPGAVLFVVSIGSVPLFIALDARDNMTTTTAVIIIGYAAFWALTVFWAFRRWNHIDRMVPNSPTNTD